MKYAQYVPIPRLADDVKVNGVTIYGRPIRNTKPIDVVFGWIMFCLTVLLILLIAYYFGTLIKDAVMAEINNFVNISDLQMYIKEGVHSFKP